MQRPGWATGAGQGVFDDLVIRARAQQNSDRGPLVRRLHVAIQCLDIKAQRVAGGLAWLRMMR